jgi:hypothetical protein
MKYNCTKVVSNTIRRNTVRCEFERSTSTSHRNPFIVELNNSNLLRRFCRWLCTTSPQTDPWYSYQNRLTSRLHSAQHHRRLTVCNLSLLRPGASITSCPPLANAVYHLLTVHDDLRPVILRPYHCHRITTRRPRPTKACSSHSHIRLRLPSRLTVESIGHFRRDDESKLTPPEGRPRLEPRR